MPSGPRGERDDHRVMLARAPKRDLHDMLRRRAADPRSERDEAENELYESCFELSEAAKRLERAAGRPDSAAAATAALDCLAESMSSLANSLLMIGEEFDAPRPQGWTRGQQRQSVQELLHAGAQNLRFAQASLNSARAVAGPISNAG
jgi:hypothetical protein